MPSKRFWAFVLYHQIPTLFAAIAVVTGDTVWAGCAVVWMLWELFSDFYHREEIEADFDRP